MVSDRRKRTPTSPEEPAQERVRDRVPLPRAVAAALEQVGAEKSEQKRAPWGGRALALVPVFVMLMLAGLLFPRAAAPVDFPLPLPDSRVLDSVALRDRQDAAIAEGGLSDDARVLGTEVRRFNGLQRSDADEASMIEARGALNRAIAQELASHPGELKLLRAAELAIFLRAIDDFETTGVESPDLVEIGGTFVPRMRSVGWIVGRRVLPDRAVRAVLFKLTWGAVLNLAADASLDPTLDEQRALYAFYIQNPHPGDSRRPGIEGARAAARAAKDAVACEEVRLAETMAIEEWRADKLRKLGELDPEYPLSFALGVSHFRERKYAASAEAFRDWLRLHPDGPLALRAQNHLKAAIAADGTL